MSDMQSLTLSDENGLDVLWLHGSGAQAPVCGAVRAAEPRPLGDGWVEEEVHLALEGSGISAFLEALEERLADGRTGVRPCYLVMQPEADDPPWRAPLRDGSLELIGGGLSERRGFSQGVRLRLVRPNWWEGALQALPLSTPATGRSTSGVRLYNHHDATPGHSNAADLSAGDLPGSLPAPCQIILRPAQNERLMQVVLALGSDLTDADGALLHTLEGEDGQPGQASAQVLLSSTASAGAFSRLTWQAGTATHLWSAVLSAQALGYLRGRSVRPVLRLHNAPPQPGVILRWQVSATPGGTPLAQSALFPLQVGHALQPTAGITLPPLPLGGGPYQPLWLDLWVEDAPAGTQVLDLDFIHLLPTEGWLQAFPLEGTPPDWELVLDGFHEACYSRLPDGSAQRLTHALGGEWPLLRPHHAQRLYLLWESEAGAAVDAGMDVRLFCRPRREVL